MNYTAAAFKKARKTVNKLKIKIMPTFFGNLAQNAAGQATGGAIAMGIQRLGVNYDQRKQRQQAQALQDIQIGGEKQLMDYQNEKQLEMWKNTSYSAQMEQLMKAGLNPGLLYGMGGGGGQSMGGGIPSVGGASAQSPNTASAGASAAGMGILTKAQLDLIKAQTDATEANAEATRAGIPNIPKQGKKLDVEVESITQGIQNQKAQQVLTESQTKAVDLANQITAASKYDQIAMWAEQVDNLVNKTRQEVINANVSEATADDKIKQIKAEAAGAAIDNILKDAQIGQTKEATAKLSQDIKASIRQLQQTDSQQRIEMTKAGITKMLGERGLDIAQQGVIMGVLDKVIGGISQATK